LNNLRLVYTAPGLAFELLEIELLFAAAISRTDAAAS
jgi:hypothetical protein